MTFASGLREAGILLSPFTGAAKIAAFVNAKLARTAAANTFLVVRSARFLGADDALFRARTVVTAVWRWKGGADGEVGLPITTAIGRRIRIDAVNERACNVAIFDARTGVAPIR